MDQYQFEDNERRLQQIKYDLMANDRSYVEDVAVYQGANFVGTTGELFVLLAGCDLSHDISRRPHLRLEQIDLLEFLCKYMIGKLNAGSSMSKRGKTKQVYTAQIVQSEVRVLLLLQSMGYRRHAPRQYVL